MFDSRSKDKTKRIKMEPKNVNKEAVNSRKVSAPGIVNATSSNRVIRKVVLLDPTKIKKLGLESRIIQAVNKLKDTPTIAKKPAENIRKIGSVSSKDIENSEKSKAPVPPKSTPDSFFDKAGRELREGQSQSNRNQVQKKLRSISENTSKVIKDFNGFTNVEIAEGRGDLKRLSDFIGSYKQAHLDQIPSFKHLKTYLCNKKCPDKGRTNKGERRWSCPVASEPKEIVGQTSENQQTDTEANSSLSLNETLPIEILPIEIPLIETPPAKTSATVTNPPPKIEQIISPNIFDEPLRVKEETVDLTYNINYQNYPAIQDPIISVGPPLQNRGKSNKGIVILDQKIIKTGFYPEVKSEVISDSEQKIELPPPKSNNNPPTEQGDRTILIKILGQDSDSNDIHIEVLDPLIKMQVPKEPADPIKNICKSYVKKMLKTSGIKRIKINPIEKSPKKGQAMKTSPTVAVDLTREKMLINDNINLLGNPNPYSNDQSLIMMPQQNYSQASSREMPLAPYPSVNPSGTSYQQSLSYNLPSNISNTNKSMHHNQGNMPLQSTTLNQNANIACAINDDAMDAVEYILNCTQGNDMVDNTTNFEDEDDLEEVDWGDEEENCDEFQDLTSQNCSTYTTIANELAPDSKRNIINMIEQAEITFASDHNGSFQADISGTINQPISETGQASEHIIPEHTTIMPASNDSIEIFTIKEIDPAKDVCNQVAANEIVPHEPINLEPPIQHEPFKKRKLTIKKYENMKTTAISEIQERIKQRMICKTQSISSQLISSETTTKSTQLSPSETSKDIKPQTLPEHTDQSNSEIISCGEEMRNEQPISLVEVYSENTQISDDALPASIRKDDVRTVEEPSSEPTANQTENSIIDPPQQQEEIKSQSVEAKPILPKGKGRRFKVTPVMRNRARPMKQIKTENIAKNINDSIVVKSEKSHCDDDASVTVHNVVESTESKIRSNIENSLNVENSIHTESSINSENSCSVNSENSCQDINSSNIETVEPDGITLNNSTKTANITQKAIKKEKTSLELKTPKTIKQEKSSNFDIIKNSCVNLPVEQTPILHENETTNIVGNNSCLDREVHDHQEYFDVIEYNAESYHEDERVTNSEEHDEIVIERKSNRARKPTSKADFIPITNKKRKDKTEKEQLVNVLSTADQHLQEPVYESGLKVYKSRRKNTIPEIDKLALLRKSMAVDNQESRNSNQIDLDIPAVRNVECDSPSTFPKSVEHPNTNGIQANESSITPARKRGRPRKNPLNMSKISDTTQNTSPPIADEMINSFNFDAWSDPEIPQPKKKRNTACDYELHPRLLLANCVDEMNAKTLHAESMQIDLNKTSQCVRCGACKQFVEKQSFQNHIKEHYGVGWTDGLEKPINLSSYREVVNAMQSYMVKSKTPAFACKVCGESKRSAAGVIAHLQSCLLTKEQFTDLMLSCEFCSKAFLPPALWTHVKTCRKNPEILKKQSDEKDQNVDDVGSRRKSAIKANSSFKSAMEASLSPDDFIKPYASPKGGGLILRWRREITFSGRAKCFGAECPFATGDIEQLKTHIKDCKFIPHGGFSCVRCQYYDADKENARKHVLEKHAKLLNNKSSTGTVDAADNSNDSTVSESDLTIDEVEKRVEMKIRRQLNLKKIVRRTSDPKNDDTYGGTLRIYEKMYTDDVLYPKLKPSEVTVTLRNYDSFKPTLEKSIKFGAVATKQINEFIGASKPPSTWSELEPFEKKQIEDEMILFIGGPISHMAWVPHPSAKECSAYEYLAVSYKKSYSVHRKFVGQPEENEVILIYQIKMPDDKKREIKTELLYGVQLSGPTHHFVFLPSGGYAPEINRLGVLAVATAKSSIHVYSLPLKASDENCDKKFNQPLCSILDIKPSLILCVDLSENPYHIEGCMAQCTRIVWSEMKDHHIIVGGFSNGFVGIWSIRENNLTKINSSEFQYCIPLSYFNAIPHAVSGLALHYAPEGPRWLFVTNRTREFQTYDLDDLTSPTQVGPVLFQKSSLSGAVWPVYSENPTVALDDDYLDDVSFVFCRSILNVNYKLKNIMHSPAGFKCVDFSPFYNSIVGGCENGDIIVQRFRKFSNESCFSNTFPRWFVFFTDICRLNGEPIPIVNPKELEGNVVDDEVAQLLDSFKTEYSNTHALLFGGPIACDRMNKSRTVSTARIVPSSLRPLTRINCIALCPNFLSGDIAAIGYNNGLIRLKIINYDEFL